IGREFSHTLLTAVARKPEPEVASALDRIIAAGLLFRQGVPPQASYLFKHALVQDAAYGTLLREPRRSLHARTAETLESQFVEVAENRPELLARHCTEAGLIEKAVAFWGKAGQRSLERSALVEAVEQLTRALAQIATLPASPVQRREEIRCQVLELELEELLRGRFPTDSIEPVGKGELGADVIQQVNGAIGQSAGIILWETKRTKAWSDSWLAKLRDDQRRCNADVALIISHAL